MTPPKSTLFPHATASDLRTAAMACRVAAKVGELDQASTEAEDAHYLLGDFDFFGTPGIFAHHEHETWSGIAKILEDEADKIDPPPPQVILYTSAPASYDGFSCRELDANAGVDNRGKIIRKVTMDVRDAEWHRCRYSSGLHGSATPDEVEKFRTIWRLKESE